MLSFAASSSFRKEGNLEASKLLEKLGSSSKESALALQACTTIKAACIKIDVELALATLSDCGLSKHQYEILARNHKNLGNSVLLFWVILS